VTTPSGAAFAPIRVGTMQLARRLVVSSHSGGGGSLLGPEPLFERHCAYWTARLHGGAAWVGGGPTFVANPLIPGFEPTGVGANGPGLFRAPNFVERMSRFMQRLHEAGGFGSVQFVQQGGMPSAPSASLSGYAEHRIPHALHPDEIAWLVREYGESAALAAAGEADALELHANHDDVLQWFLSPVTNHRTDGYGGSAENRRRLLREVVESMRASVDRPITIGLRLCLDEMIDGGRTVADCQELVAAFTADATVDYFSLDVGDNWGRVSYIPPGTYEEAEWAPLCGQVKQATRLPVVYVGRVTSVASAERIIAAGQADVVGFTRALIADPALVEKTLAGRTDEVRPCIALQECIDRRVVENLPFACGVNPRAGREDEPPPPTATDRLSVLVVGGGPAGTEFAAQMAERGHRVQLWEQSAELGGQLAIAARLRLNALYGKWIPWQQARLARAGVGVQLERVADSESVRAASPDIVAVATGARSRRPDVPGIDLPHVVTAVDVAAGVVTVGHRVLVVSEDDRLAPLAVTDQLAGDGHEVCLAYQSLAPSPLVGKYTIGAVMARLDDNGVRVLPMTRLVSVATGKVTLANVYSGRRFELTGFDSIVLACGSVPVDDLYLALKDEHPRVHLLGDAFAPRRVVFATRQAFELARTFDR
jgi:2,4-dienoyl-CoA reductase-like NADH-dependent reductase (Old Yellow Enzyme family)/NADPH-dependent 2,4-dienoyl-CoA reductase/sulfur reductase-like enzyme